jgi:tetratricopeptide (TPR) repeat protein
MSGASNTKRLLKTSAAVAAAGTVAFAPLTPLAQTEADTRAVVVRIGAAGDFTRVEFSGPVGSRAQVRRRGDEVVVRLPAGAQPDVARLLVDPPAGVARAQTRVVASGTEVVLNLTAGADVRSGRADGAVYLNLYPAGGAAPAAPPPPMAVPPSGAVPVAVQASPTQASFSFAWAQPVGAAVFRRGEAVWVVFDTAARLDLDGAAGDVFGPVEAVRWASGENYLAVRIAAPEGLAVTASSQGAVWTVTVGGQPQATTGVTVSRDDTSLPAMVAQMAGATRAIWLTDPLVGDRFAAVTALGPAKGFDSLRRTVDLTLLPTAQGMAVETATDNLTITAEGDLVRLTRPSGLSLSSPAAAFDAATASDASAPRRAPTPALVLEEWAATGADSFTQRHRGLQGAATAEMAAAVDNPRASIEARLAYARFLVGTGLSYEAIGALNALVAAAPNMIGEAEVRGLRGAARAAVGRYAEAQADFAAASLAHDPSAKAWLGYIAAEQGDWVAARQAFAQAAPAIDRFPQVWRARFGAAHARAALETGDLPAARVLLAYAFSQNAPAADQLAARLTQARLFEIEGRSAQALAIFKAVARAPLEGVATPAKLGVTRIELATGAITPVQAAAQLEPLRWRWRGDATELSVIRTLGDIYLSQGRYREALDVLRGAGSHLANLPEGVQLQADLAGAFRALFLEGAADGLQPVQALALFYDFRELTPVGAEGDDMVRRLARRLVDVDLLAPAAELLKHQVDNRLDGVAQAQVATDLALVYLMNRQPEAALQALWASRTTLLPTALNTQRRAIEARALMGLGRFDHALEILGNDQGQEAQDVRAEVFWMKQNYAGAAAIYEARLGERWKDTATPLSAEEESRLIRAGVGYSLAQNEGAVGRLGQRYGGFAERARAGAAVRIALDTADGSGTVSPGDYAALAVQADLFAGWVSAVKTTFRERTGGAAAG